MDDSYRQARKDHEYLWSTYNPAHDMTGGYIDQNDLARLLKSPTKATAKHCYEAQIDHWFKAGPEPCSDEWKRDPEVRAIAKRHFCDTDLLDD